MSSPLVYRQFFNPYFCLSSSSEHETRVPDIAKLEIFPGKTAFGALYPSGPVDDKLQAVAVFTDVLDQIGSSDNLDAKDSALAQLFLAMSIKNFYLTEDMQPVTEALRPLIVGMFAQAVKITAQGRERFEYGDRIFSGLIQKANWNYEDDHPGSMRLPNLRAEDLIRDIVAVDKELLDLKTCSAWGIYDRTAERLGLTLTLKGEPLAL